MSGGDHIKDLAYHLWIEAGCPEGRDQEFWYAAEERLAAAPAEAPAPKGRAKAKAAAAPVEAEAETAPKPKRAAGRPRASKPKTV